MDPRSIFRLRKTDRPCEKWAGVFQAAVVCPSMAKSDEDAAVEHLDLVDEVFILLSRGMSMDVQPCVSEPSVKRQRCLL